MKGPHEPRLVTPSRAIDRTDQASVEAGKVPASPREPRLLSLGVKIEYAAVRHWQEQADLPHEQRRGARHQYIVTVDVPPEPGRLEVGPLVELHSATSVPLDGSAVPVVPLARDEDRRVAPTRELE